MKYLIKPITPLKGWMNYDPVEDRLIGEVAPTKKDAKEMYEVYYFSKDLIQVRVVVKRVFKFEKFKKKRKPK